MAAESIVNVLAKLGEGNTPWKGATNGSVLSKIQRENSAEILAPNKLNTTRNAKSISIRAKKKVTRAVISFPPNICLTSFLVAICVDAEGLEPPTLRM